MTQSTPATGAAPAADGADKLDRGIFAVGGVVVLGAVMAMLDVTVVNVALDHLITVFHSTLAKMQWVATGYALALATVIPLSGWAADRFGTKRVYLTAVLLFIAGSTLAGNAWSADSLIVFRVLQGLGGGMLLPLSMTILVKAAGPERIGRVMAILGIALQLGPIIGPVVGGWLVQDVSWRAIFFVNVPIGIATLALGARILPRDEPQAQQKLDLLGLLLLSPGLAAIIYGLVQVSSHNTFADPAVYLPATAGTVLVLMFLWHAANTPHALIDLRMFRNRGFSTSSVTLVLYQVAVFGSLLLFPLYFQQVRGAGPLSAGLRVAPQGIGVMVMMPITGRLVDRGWAARLVPTGIVVIGAAIAVLTHITATTPYWILGIALFALGLGMGMAGMPNMSIALKTLRRQDVARASTSLTIIQQCAGAIGTATLSVILFKQVKTGLAPALAALRAQSPGAPPTNTTSLAGAPDGVRQVLAPPLAHAYATTFLWALILLAVAFVPALLLSRVKPTPAAQPAAVGVPGAPRSAEPAPVATGNNP